MIFLTGLGALCFVYGILIMRIRSGTLFYVAWFVLGGCCLAAALFAGLDLKKRIPGPVLVTGAVLLLGGLVSFCICEAFIVRGFYEKGQKNLPYLIVLGAQVREEGPSRVLAYRLDAAAQYMEAHPRTVCIVTGGKGRNEPVTEGSAMKRYLVEKGVPSSRILVEERAENTKQNIRYSLAFLPSRDVPAGIVTNNFHVARALALARRQGLKNACGISAPSDPLYLPNNMLREYFGVMKDFLCSYRR